MLASHMTKRRKITTIAVSSIIVVGAYFFFMTTEAELKKKWFGRLPTDIDRLKVTAVYPRDDPNAQEVYFEYASPSLYRELDALLKFRPVKRFVESAHSCLGEAMIYFYRGDKLCQVRWNFAHDDFFHPGLLTAKSKKNLIKWFESKGFAMFSKGHVEGKH
jgi:hypothetical protein